jgi:hypothetical protein
MPVSDYHQISDVLAVVEQANPEKVLDVGVGFGKWGILCREVLELYKKRVHPSTWTVQIDGIEINEPYRNPLWELAYDRVYIGDVLEVLDLLDRYGLILCCDVIEHLDKEMGKVLLAKLCDHGDLVVITSPRGFAPQGAIYDNEHERHLSGWTAQDFDGVPHIYKDIGFTFMAVVSSDAARLRAITIRGPLDALGAKRGVIEALKLAARRLRHRFAPSPGVARASINGRGQ